MMEVSKKLAARRAKVRAAFEAGVADRAAWLKRMEELNHGQLKPLASGSRRD